MTTPYLLPALVQASRECIPDPGLGNLRLRGAFVLNGATAPAQSRQILFPDPGTALDRIMRDRPALKGILVWPYIRADWSVRTRLDRFIGHYALVDTLGPAWVLSDQEKIRLLDLGALMNGLTVVLDQPVWFMREGGFSLNLFVDDFRAFTVAFSLCREADGGLTFLVGGIQGRDRPDALDIYRAMTKALHGIRPRDFVIELLRLLGRTWGVSRILCVSNAAHHRQHRFFGFGAHNLDYDAIWQDRGGTRVGPSEFELAPQRIERPLEQIASKKRSLYRKRYAFLAELDGTADRGFPDAERVMFEAT